MVLRLIGGRTLTYIFLHISYLYDFYNANSDSFYFTVNPNDQDVEEGQPLRLSCAVTPSKDIYYSWLHNGTRLQLEKENGRRYLEVDSNLQILHADRELDPGTYQCQALNRSSTFTTASREAKVNVYWIDSDVKVVLVKPSEYTKIGLGREVELACNVRANPPLSPANIKWFHNGNARLPNTEFHANGNLRIPVFGIEHTGGYHCRVVHASGKLDSRPPFLIHISGGNVGQLVTDLKNENFSKFVMRGRTVELTCPQIGAPTSMEGLSPITVWGTMPRLGEQQRPISSLRDVQFADQDSKLVISNFDVNHASFYTCEITWPGLPDKYIFLFQVEMAALYYPKRSDFSPRLKKNQAYILRIGEDANLRYYSDQSPSNSFGLDQISNPTPTIEWRKSGDRLPIPAWPVFTDVPTSTPVAPRIHALRGRHLIINEVRESDSGAYEMILSNIAGRASITFDIQVNFPPEFFQPLTHEEHVLDQESSITLDCGVKKRSIPGSIVYWEKDQRVFKKYESSLVILENNGEILKFPRLKPEDQGQYQCFVQTDGYSKRWPGREQTLIVKAKLQFLREISEQFLEINVQGRIPCKVRGYGVVNVEWFRKTGKHLEDLQRIRPPNQVESGTLIIQYVQKQDAGEYICIATSTYKNAQINMTVKVIVGEKPQISQISTNQTVRVGAQLQLHCRATGDPQPQISWIVKKLGYKIPTVYTPVVEGENNPPNEELQNPNESQSEASSALLKSETLGVSFLHSSNSPVEANANEPGDADVVMAAISRNLANTYGRITAYPNGSLIIRHVLLPDHAEYICVAGNKHAIKTRQGVFVRVLTPEEYTRQQLGEVETGSGMLKTIFIVVGCAVTYLVLIISITVFCSMRMLRNRRNRSRKGEKLHENGQLLSHLNDPVYRRNRARGSQECSLLPGMSATSHLNHFSEHSRPNLSRSSCNADIRTNTNALIYPGPAVNQSKTENKCWWPITDNTPYAPADVKSNLLQTGQGDGFITPRSEASELNNHLYIHEHSLMSGGCNFMYSGLNSIGGEGSKTITSTTSDSHMVTAPPPTPLDSRSHLSGVSSGNSTSLYSRSLLSGASNTGSLNNQVALQMNDSSAYDRTNGLRTLSQLDRMNYPRCELQIEGVLGKGEFGDVFLARAHHIQVGETQSLVLIKSLTSHEALHVNEFHRQLELFGQSDHCHITHLLGVCMEQEPFYLLLEYCEWGDLKQFLRCMREENSTSFKMPALTLEQKLNICKQLASGMEYLSSMHCVHRDLAARNVLLAQKLDVKISILGLARDVYANEYYRLSNSEHFIPLRWLAPELIYEFTKNNKRYFNSRGESCVENGNSNSLLPYSTESDVWAFGVLISEVFNLATLPLSELSDEEIVLAGQQTAIQAGLSKNACNKCDGNPKTMTTAQRLLKPDLPSELPTELANLLNNCWSPSQQNRPQFHEISLVLNGLVF